MHKSSPTPLDRDWNDISDFKAAYQDYLGGGAAFQTLSVDDAEWLLEAAFNEAHAVTGSVDTVGTIVQYDELTPFDITTAQTPNDEDVVKVMSCSVHLRTYFPVLLVFPMPCR